MCSEAEKEEEERGEEGRTQSACVMWYLKLKESYQIALLFHAETRLFSAFFLHLRRLNCLFYPLSS